MADFLPCDPTLLRNIKCSIIFLAGLFDFQKLTYAIMLGHMKKVNHFEHKFKKPKMSVRTFLPRAFQLNLCNYVNVSFHNYVNISILFHYTRLDYLLLFFCYYVIIITLNKLKKPIGI